MDWVAARCRTVTLGDFRPTPEQKLCSLGGQKKAGGKRSTLQDGDETTTAKKVTTIGLGIQQDLQNCAKDAI